MTEQARKWHSKLAEDFAQRALGDMPMAANA
jgi:hypothetical protein